MLGLPIADVVTSILVDPLNVSLQFVTVREGFGTHVARVLELLLQVNSVNMGLERFWCLQIEE